MDEESSGIYLKFEDDERVVVDIMSEPVKGISKFTWPDGNEKIEYTFDVRKEGTTKTLKWAVSSRSILQQIVGIMKKEGLTRIAGTKIEVDVKGAGKNRRYFLKPVKMGKGF